MNVTHFLISGDQFSDIIGAHFLLQKLPENAAIGIDPWCVSIDTAQKWERAFAKKGQKLVETSKNLVDEVWKDRPPVEINPVIVHPLEFSGRSVEEKLKDLRQKLTQEKARGIIFTTLDEVSICCQFPRILQLLLHYLLHLNVLSGFCHVIVHSFCSSGCLAV